MVKAMDCWIVISEFELQSRYYVQFWTNTHGEGYETPLSPPPAMGLNSTTIVLLDGWLWHQITYNGWYAIKGGACGVMVIVVGNGHGDTSSYPGRDWLYVT